MSKQDILDNSPFTLPNKPLGHITTNEDLANSLTDEQKVAIKLFVDYKVKEVKNQIGCAIVGLVLMAVSQFFLLIFVVLFVLRTAQ